MKTSRRIPQLVDELAAHWTEPALEILKSVGHSRVTVQSEIETWRSLSAALQSAVEERRRFSSSPAVSLRGIREKVFGQAIEALVRENNLSLSWPEIYERSRVLILNSQSTAAERELFGVLAREQATAYKAPRQTDFAPRFERAAVGG